MTNVPIQLLSELLPQKVEEKSKFKSIKKTSQKKLPSRQQQQQQQLKKEELEKEKEAENPRTPQHECKARTRLHDSDLSSEDREEKMIRICLTDPKWISAGDNLINIL